MLNIRTEKIINVSNWDKLIEDTYGRPYNLQQQDGCMERQMLRISIPGESCDDEQHDSIPEVVNGEEMCVKFATWLARDPKQDLADGKTNSWSVKLFYERNFYPELQTVANDLHAKGLIPAGDYLIEIDW